MTMAAAQCCPRHFFCTLLAVLGSCSTTTAFHPRRQLLSARIPCPLQHGHQQANDNNKAVRKNDEAAPRRLVRLKATLPPVLQGGDSCGFCITASFQETENLWSQEWHDSFLRNGLTDFVPPLSSNLKCLLIGGDGDHQALLLDLPWKTTEVDPARTRQLSSVPPALNDREAIENPNLLKSLLHGGKLDDNNPERSSASSWIDGLFEDDSSLELAPGQVLVGGGDDEEAANYDCILDTGLMDSLVTWSSHNDVGLLLLEATRHIREYGILVTVTREQLPSDVKEYLVNTGELMGMYWKFDLDGISTDESYVHVARRYSASELPSSGQLIVEVADPRKP